MSVCVSKDNYVFVYRYSIGSDLISTCCVCSEWYLNGNYLVVFVSIGVILPLSLLKNLGKDSVFTNF